MNLPSLETVPPFVVYLCTDEAADINGIIFATEANGEYGIYSEPELKQVIKKEAGLWTVDELIEQVPKKLLEGY